MEPSFVLYFSTIILLIGIPKGECGSIIGGKESFPHSRPFMALIRGRKFCGGTLVKQNWVLTAAHCDVDKTHEVVLGAHSLKKKEESQQILKIAELKRHPCFSEEPIDHDLMLLQLQKPAKLNQYVKTIKLPTTHDDLKAGTQCLVAGWGITHTRDRKPSDTLHEANITVIDRRICNDRKHYNFRPIITMNMVCAGDKKGKKDTGQGDSGGPLICKGEQRGITSFGKQSKWSIAQYPGVYTRLTKAHLLWINDTIKGN